MSLNLKIQNIERVIAHTIIQKTSTKEAYIIEKNDLLHFSKAEKAILIDRLEGALNNHRKTFQLDYEDKSNDSIYYFLDSQFPIDDDDFLLYSQRLANNLASAHFRTTIPGGYCLIGEGKTDKNKEFFFIIKAELQEVFEIKGIDLKLIKDVFLSPAKDFYKVAFFIRESTTFIPYMYDDQFSMQKKDLTEYFYSHFLGLTTHKNDSLKSKNFFEDTKSFIENNVDNVQDRLGLLKALQVLYREDTSGLISPKDFSDKYFEGKLKNRFDSTVIKKHPFSFTKDVSLIDRKLNMERITIPFSYTISLVGNANYMNNIEIIDKIDSQTEERMQHEFNSGTIKKMILLKEPDGKTE